MVTATKPQRLANLDGLRLICALAVMAFHYGHRGSLEGLYAPLLSVEALADGVKYGHIGVHIFFCISGFVIAYSAEGRSAFSFAASRFARIYPTFVLCLTLLFTVRWFWGQPVLPVSFAQYLAGLTLLPQLFHHQFVSGVYWSIVVEVLFYSWVFLFMLSGLFQRQRNLIIALWLLVSAFNEFYWGQGAVRLALITEFAPFFAFGMLLQSAQAKPHLDWATGLLMACATAMGVTVLLHETAEIRATFGVSLSDAVSAAVLLLGFVVTILAVEVKRPMLPFPILVWAGGISYPLYLLHEGLGQVAFVNLRPFANGSVLFVVTAVTVIALSSAIWWCFDRFALSWTRRMLEQLFANLSDKLTIPQQNRA
jgi:peptidoglycan/LPS O-acetylase OafA/YrhL